MTGSKVSNEESTRACHFPCHVVTIGLCDLFLSPLKWVQTKHSNESLSRSDPRPQGGRLRWGGGGSGAGIGTRFDIYPGLAKGNQDLFQRREPTSSEGAPPDIYQGLGRSPDLSY
jgi:hypothetical protein